MTEALREDLLQRLDELARAEHRSINEFVEDILTHYAPPAYASNDPEIEALPLGSLARLAAAGRGMPPIGEPDNTSEIADDILRDEYADYLLARVNRSTD